MKFKHYVGWILLLLTNFAYTAEYHVFFLGGQSNMDGYGYNSELPENLDKQHETMIFHGNGVFDNQKNGGLGKWSYLKPGHGAGFTSDGLTNKYSNRFGPELSFAATLTANETGKKFAIIKYAVGGTALHLHTGFGNWSPDFRKGEGKNQYDFALNSIKNASAVSDIDGDGQSDTLIPAGIIWMQGEADAHENVESANAYLDNLTRLMGLLRAALRDDSIPIVIGKITDSELGAEDLMPHIKTVHLAQELFVAQDACATYMTATENYRYNENDPWHYISESYVRMGKDFADAYSKLVKKCTK